MLKRLLALVIGIFSIPLAGAETTVTERDFKIFNQAVGGETLNESSDGAVVQSSGSLREIARKEHLASGITVAELYQRVEAQLNRLRPTAARLSGILWGLRADHMACRSDALEIGIKAGLLFPAFGAHLGVGIMRNGVRSYPLLYLRLANISAGSKALHPALGICVDVGLEHRESPKESLHRALEISQGERQDAAALIFGSYKHEAKSGTKRIAASGISVGFFYGVQPGKLLDVSLPLKFLGLRNFRIADLLNSLDRLMPAIIQNLQHLEFGTSEALIERFEIDTQKLCDLLARRGASELLALPPIPASDVQPIYSPGNLFHPKNLVKFSPALVNDLMGDACETKALPTKKKFRLLGSGNGNDT